MEEAVTLIAPRAARHRRGGARRGGARPPIADARPTPRPLGRAWINGREVGGTEARHATLAGSYD